MPKPTPAGSNTAGADPAVEAGADPSSPVSRPMSRCCTSSSNSARRDTAKRLHDTLHDETVGTPQALTERDAAAALYTDRLAALRAAEHGLAFGRLDTDAGESRYIGRIGLLDEQQRVRAAADGLARPGGPPVLHGDRGVAGGHAPAPAPAHPAAREVIAIDDEVAATSTTPGRRSSSSGLTSEAALLAAVSEASDRADGRHRRDHPVRAGRDHPVQAVRRARRAGRAGHRQDGGRPAPRRLPALHPPRPAGPPRRARRRAEPDVPALHRPGAAVAGRDRASCSARSGSSTRPRRPPPRGPGDGGGQGPRRDGRGRSRPPCATASRCRAGRSSSSSSSSGCGWTATSSTRPAPGPGAPAGRTTRPSGSSARRRCGCWPTRSPAASAAGCAGLLDAGDVDDIREELTESRGADAASSTSCGRRCRPEQLLTELFADRKRLQLGRPADPGRGAGAPGPRRARTTRRRPTSAVEPRGRRRCSTRPPSCSATTAASRAARGGRGAARGGAVRPGRARRARPRGGPRPGAAARHRRRRRRPARRAPAGRAATTRRPTGPRRTASGPTGT